MPLWRRRYNTHKVDIVIVYYPWHPLYQQEIKVITTKNRGGELYFKVRLNDSSCIEIPFWMTDKDWCQQFTFREAPYCCMQALIELKKLLEILAK